MLLMSSYANNSSDDRPGEGKGKKVLLAMSGGVDSSVSAAILQQQGYEVVGAFMSRIGASQQPVAGGSDQACGSARDADDAKRLAELMGIELHVLNLGEQFAEIIDYFVGEYATGRTPNPCAMCNMKLKFGLLIDLANSLGCDGLATGHYARTGLYQGSPAVLRGPSRQKDQSYILFGIAKKNLGRIILPMGEMEDKAAVRKLARSLGLGVHDKPDSQDICFIDGDDYTTLLARRAPQALTPGRIIDTAGCELGRHTGYGRYTIGQRRGLGVATGAPAYVTKIDPATGDVTLGTREEASSQHLRAERANWHHKPGENSFQAIVQIRYNHRGSAATVRLVDDGGAFEVDFHEPIHAITPGQAAVVYDGQTLLGGGWIA